MSFNINIRLVAKSDPITEDFTCPAKQLNCVPCRKDKTSAINAAAGPGSVLKVIHLYIHIHPCLIFKSACMQLHHPSSLTINLHVGLWDKC